MSHNLVKIPAFDEKTRCCRAVIETRKGSHHKFSYNADLACFELKKTLPEGMTFPLDFGFIPSTLADDGDPVDILVILDFPAEMGAFVKVRLIGGIEAEQREKDGKWEENDRLIAVARHSRTLAPIRSLEDLGQVTIDQLIAFFEQYNRLEEKEFRSTGICTPKRAKMLVEKGVKAFRKKH